jgi:excisionase family DNA binding protein
MTTALLNVDDVAARLGISRSHAYRLIASGEIAVTRISRGVVRVTEEALAEFVAAKTSPPRKSRRGAAA